MPQILAGRAGAIKGTASSNFATARSSNGTNVYGTSGGSVGIAFRYFFNSGRGGGTHSIYRTYLYFNTTGIAASAANILINGASNNAASFIIAKSTAFGGDGGSALDTADFTEITTTNYTSQQGTWNISGTTPQNTISLNSTAVTDINNNNAFIVVFMNSSNDFLNSAATSNTALNNGVNFGLVSSGFLTIKLDYTAAATSNITSVNTIARSNITSFNTIALADIDKINGISN